MKHLKNLAYNVVQFNFRIVIFIGVMIGAPGAIIYSNPIFWAISLPVTFIGAMVSEHKKYKSTGKY